MQHDDAILEQATGWAVRIGDPAFEEWDAFTRWLAENPAHTEAYDRVSAAVAEATELARSAPTAANDEAPAHSRHSRRWFGGAIAASVAVALAVGVWQMRDDRYTVETAPGQQRAMAIAGGGKIELAGGTRLTLDRDDPRFARLDQGQAMFSIQHDAAHPFTLHLGEDTVVDIGTAFDVRRDQTGVTVAVSEGKVAFTPHTGASVNLDPGSMLTKSVESDEYSLSQVPIDQVGEWREGRLTFRQASLAEIASRVSRATGVSYSAAPGSSAQAYSGSVLTAPLRNDPRALGPLLGVKVTPAGNGWVIEAH